MSLAIEDIKSLWNFLVDRYFVIKSLLLAIFSFFSFILSLPTFFGMPFWEMITKIFNWKDRKAIEYDIVYTKYKESNIVLFKRWCISIIEIYIPIWVWGLSVSALHIIEYWISVNDVNFHSYICIIGLILLCIMAYMIHKMNEKRKPYIELCRIVILILISLYALLIIALFYNNSLGVMFVGGVVSLMFITVILVWDFLGLYQEYKDKYRWLRYSRLFRYLAIIFGTLVFFYKLSIMKTDNLSFSFNVALAIYAGWIIICCVEFGFLYKNRYSKLVEYEITIENETIKTSCRISQYSGNKVKVKLNNGKTRIIDADKIDFIEYEVENNKRSKLKRVVTCFLKSDMENIGLEYRGYKYIKDSWVAFYEINEGVKKIRIINIRKIREILIEQLSKKA